MRKIKNILFTILAILLMTFSIWITGCSSSAITEITHQIHFTKTGTIHSDLIGYDFSYKLVFENDIMSFYVAGLLIFQENFDHLLSQNENLNRENITDIVPIIENDKIKFVVK